MKINPRSYWLLGRMLSKQFYVRSYKTKVNVGQGCISLQNEVRYIEKLFRCTRIKMTSSLQIK